MVVAARQQLRRNLAASARKSVFENRGHGAVQKAISVLLPEPIQGVVSRSPEGARSPPKAPEVLGRTTSIDLVLLLEVPPQLAGVIQAKRPCQFLPARILVQLRGFDQVARHE